MKHKIIIIPNQSLYLLIGSKSFNDNYSDQS